MTRFLTLLLLVVMAAPANVWAGQAMPDEINLVGPSCCGVAIDADTENPQSELEKACCCSPSPKSASSAGAQMGPPASDSVVLPLANAGVSVLPKPATTLLLSTDNSARGPPPRWSLLAQFTSLVI